MPPVPDYLIAFIFSLVIIPSLVTMFLRYALHTRLIYLEKRVSRLVNQEALGKQPKIVQKLEKRFNEASRKSEQVNTAALIDQVYSREKVLFIYCEQIDYLCRLMPNLLLAFGLIGTFWGITINLAALSQAINQTNVNDVSSLVQELQKPLQGMGTAFIASLAGLFFSATLTVFNFLFNTTLIKYRLLSSLEDYFDNIYQSPEGQTRLDKIVQGMANSFESFLNRFGQTVREAVESSLKDKLQEIFDANIQATNLAKEVYSRFLEASGTIARSADEFQIAAARYTQAAKSFEDSDFAHILSKATVNLDSTQINFAHSTAILAESVQGMETALNQLHTSSQKLVNVGEEISRINQTSVQVLELHQSNQHSLGEIIPQLQQGAQSFQSAVTMLEKLQHETIAKADSLGEVQAELTKLVATVKSYTEGVTVGIQALGDNLVNALKQRQDETSTSRQVSTDSTVTGSPINQRLFVEEYRKAQQEYVNGNYKDAVVIIDKLLQTLPNNAQVRLLRGNIYYEMQEYQLAQNEYKLVLKISGDPQIRNNANQGLSKIQSRPTTNNLQA